VRQRWRTLGVLALLLFHFTTWLMITINFAPLVVCLLAFLPLELAPRAIASRRQSQGTPSSSQPLSSTTSLSGSA